MYFVASEYLLLDGVAGKTAITEVDAFLGHQDRRSTDELDASLISRHCDTDVSVADVANILTALEARGVLTSRRMVRCPDHSCRTFTPAEDVDEARVDGDEKPCDGCTSQDLAALDDPDLVQVYRLIATPE